MEVRTMEVGQEIIELMKLPINFMVNKYKAKSKLHNL